MPIDIKKEERIIEERIASRAEAIINIEAHLTELKAAQERDKRQISMLRRLRQKGLRVVK